MVAIMEAKPINANIDVNSKLPIRKLIISSDTKTKRNEKAIKNDFTFFSWYLRYCRYSNTRVIINPEKIIVCENTTVWKNLNIPVSSSIRINKKFKAEATQKNSKNF